MLPLTTTRVRIEAATLAGDGWEPASYSVQGTYPATVSGPTGQDRQGTAGSQQQIDAVLHLNPGVRIDENDRVTDLGTSDTYEVTYVLRRTGLGLDHTRCGLKRVRGVAG